jgi:predicted ribosome quality control (RQC) complex YloA/Tae2 family protein
MPVRWDPLLASALARELDEELAGRRIRALLFDAERRRLIAFLQESTLVFEMHTQSGWVSLLPPAPPPSDALRLAARVRKVRALPDESALVLELAEKGGRGSGVEVFVEWIGTRWNAVVVEGESRIIRHLLQTREEASRTLRVGAPYAPPPSTGRRGAGRDLTQEDWDEILGGTRGPGRVAVGRGESIAEREDEGGAVANPRSTLLRSIAWSSAVNVASLLAPDGWERWLRMTDAENWGGWILTTPRGLQPYPVRIEGVGGEATASLLDAFRVAREREKGVGSAAGLLVPAALLEEGVARLDRLRGRAHRLRKELEGAPDPAPLRHLADVLLARWGEIPLGADRVHLIDFEGASIEISLDPSLRPDENAARYYDEAGRAERARTSLPERIRRAEEEVERWGAIVEGVREGRVPPERLERALGRSQDGGPPRPGGGSKKGEVKKGEKLGTPLPYRRYRSSGGLEIRVGRGPRQNDDLTFHHSAPNDIWLHSSQVSGAHVILRWDREGNPPKKDLEEAAILAALNSGARHSKTVPITWTRRKYVRKPRKAPPGTVAVERVQTLFVYPDPELPERLESR